MICMTHKQNFESDEVCPQCKDNWKEGFLGKLKDADNIKVKSIREVNKPEGPDMRLFDSDRKVINPFKGGDTP